VCRLPMYAYGDVDVHYSVDGRVSESRLDRIGGVQAPEFSNVAELSLALGDDRVRAQRRHLCLAKRDIITETAVQVLQSHPAVRICP